MRYKFLVERYPGKNPDDARHFLAYEAPMDDNAKAKLVWDSTKPGVEQGDMVMDPGEYKNLQWVFTKEGTYVISVELQGYVRDADNKPADAGDDWKPISDNVTETSEVKEYVIQVGSKLNETEPPLFELSRSLNENSAAGTNVGKPVSVRYEGKDTNLKFSLAGDGAENFTVANVNGAAQVKVANNAIMDYEFHPNFDLTLQVTDGHDHEGNKDSPPPHIDHTVGLGIDLKNVIEPAGVTLRVSKTNPGPNEEVTFLATFGDFSAPYGVRSFWNERDIGESGWETLDVNRGKFTRTLTIQHGSGVTKQYSLTLSIYDQLGVTSTQYVSNIITVTWGNSSSN